MLISGSGCLVVKEHLLLNILPLFSPQIVLINTLSVWVLDLFFVLFNPDLDLSRISVSRKLSCPKRAIYCCCLGSWSIFRLPPAGELTPCPLIVRFMCQKSSD